MLIWVSLIQIRMEEKSMTTKIFPKKTIKRSISENSKEIGR
jgi:hypothetical protein